MPEKALLLSQLTLKEPIIMRAKSTHDASSRDSESTQTKSAHEVLPASWIDPLNGDTIVGFFKPVTTPEDNYPILLAKYDVAISVFMRMWLGETAAEDRLVLDDSGQIVGTFSKRLPDYRPMASRENPLAVDAEDPEIVNPTKVETLLEHNVARLLTAEWGIGNPDVHPYNISIKGHGSVLDYDECLPRRTLIIKGGDGVFKRLEAMLLNKPQKLVEEDLNTFPILSEGHERKHWPTHWLPGNLNWDKQFQSYKTFVKLAAMSHVRVKLASGQEVSFQEQMFESLLTMLLTYDPDMLHARLYEYLGDLPLDFMTLPETKVDGLRASDGQLFNARTDKTRFVDHMMVEFQQQYDELYRAVVFYKGFKPDDGAAAPVVSFLSFLRNRPSARKKTLGWAEEENKRSSSTSIASFDLDKMEDRYAQIWRDAHLIQFWVIWHELIRLALDIANELRIKPGFSLPDPSFKISDNITETGQVIRSLAELLRGLNVAVDSDPASKLTQGLKSLIEFLVELTKASDDYFNSTRKLLTLEANEIYLAELRRLPQIYDKKICADLYPADWAGRYVKLARNLDDLYGSLRLDLHMSSNDDELTAPAKLDYTALLNRPHTSPDVVKTFIPALFEWANSISRDDLIWHISNVKDEYEGPLLTVKMPSIFAASSEIKISNPLTCRYRGPEIAAYLKDLENRDDVDGANILAYVLSTGKCTSTSLNTSIIASILPLVLRWRRGFGGIDNVNLMSLDNALSGNEVDYVFYTQQVVDHVRVAKQFTHIYSQLSQLAFNKAMYSWANKVSSRERFEGLVNKALNEYEPEHKSDASLATIGFGFFRSVVRSALSTVGGSAPRRPEVIAYLQDRNLSNAGVLGSIFKGGGVDEAGLVASRSLNVWLFDLIFDEMKKDISMDPDGMAKDEDFEIISKVDKVAAQSYLHFSSFKDCAKYYSRQTKDQVEQLEVAEPSSQFAMASSM